jgi:hypothetical protein
MRGRNLQSICHNNNIIAAKHDLYRANGCKNMTMNRSIHQRFPED